MDPYDRVPYTDHAYAESHPDRLAVVARLSGWPAPSLDAPRVLEVGCARGGNLLPMAVSLPRATLVGVDRSALQIDEARAVAEAAGMVNATFHAASFEDVALEGAFDFVIAHGVYSWVPAALRRVLLARIASWLAPNGVAYVSFNALPGWYDRLAARDFLRFSEAAFGASPDAARASLAWLTERVSPQRKPYRQKLEGVLARLRETDTSYLVHEYLEPDHHPLHVSTFLEEAREAGLAYLGDAIPQEVALELLDDAARERAAKLDVSRAQELVDFVKNTAFRRALLVREDAREARGFRWPPELDPRAFSTLRIASRLRPSAASPAQWDAVAESVHVPDEGAQKALHALHDAAPRALTLHELGAGEDVARELFDLWLATTSLDLHAFEPKLAAAHGAHATASATSARPKASPLARLHATRGGPLTNLWHQEVVVPEDVVRFILGLLDGTRTEDDLAKDVVKVAKPGLAPNEAKELVRVAVKLLADSALLVAEE